MKVEIETNLGNVEVEKMIRLDRKTKMLLALNIFEIVLSLWVAFMEKRFEWVIIAMLWVLVTLDNYYMFKFKAITELLNTAQEKLIFSLMEQINKLKKGEKKK